MRLEALARMAGNQNELTGDKPKVAGSSGYLSGDSVHTLLEMHVELDLDGFEDKQELSLEFEGIGVVLKGKVRNKNFDNKYALITDEETINNYNLEIEYSIDNKISKTMQNPIYFIERAHELFFKYDLDPGEHTLKMKIKNPNKDVRLDITNLITYKKKSI